ncbi:MAG: hypothetical protein C4326_11280 [Ignavibacteria bacterium]
MDAEERHWTDNPELLERFVLNVLDPAERNELEDHLRICEVCKRAVRRELILIAGIRRSGRERFKHELKKRLPAKEQRPIAWRAILAAAAVVLIVLSVGILHQWLDSAKHDKPPYTPEQPLASTEALNSEAPQVSASQESQATNKAEKPSAPSPIRRSTTGRLSIPEVAVKAERPASTGAMQSSAARIAQDQEVAPETLLLAGSLMAIDQADVQPSAAADEPAALHLNKTLSTPSVLAPTILVRQALVEQTTRAEESKEDTSLFVPTRFERRNDTLIVTLLLPALVDSSAIAAAHVAIPTADSLIIMLPDRRIGYRLPPSWTSSKDHRRHGR